METLASSKFNYFMGQCRPLTVLRHEKLSGQYVPYGTFQVNMKSKKLNAILAVIGARGVRLALCAPTGRAAKRLAEATGLSRDRIIVSAKVSAVRDLVDDGLFYCELRFSPEHFALVERFFAA